jgi:hypothetical protein
MSARSSASIPAAAAMFVMARGRGGPNDREDAAALSDLLTLYSAEGFRVGLLRAKDVYRALHSGGCRLLSRGDACDCFLCRIDDLIAQAETIVRSHRE